MPKLGYCGQNLNKNEWNCVSIQKHNHHPKTNLQRTNGFGFPQRSHGGEGGKAAAWLPPPEMRRMMMMMMMMMMTTKRRMTVLMITTVTIMTNMTIRSPPILSLAGPISSYSDSARDTGRLPAWGKSLQIYSYLQIGIQKEMVYFSIFQVFLITPLDCQDTIFFQYLFFLEMFQAQVPDFIYCSMFNQWFFIIFL